MLASSLLLSLALMPDAEAANIPKIKTIRIRQITNENSNHSYSLTALTPDGGGEIASVSAELEGETLPLAPSDAWVHGTAALAPAEGAELTLTVYGTDNAVLDTFTGSYTDGALSLASTTRDGETSDSGCRACGDGGQTSTTAVDLEVLAATVYADGTVGLTLTGADALSVASATLGVTTTDVSLCLAVDRAGTCVEWATTRTDVEVDVDELGTVWESEAIAIDGAADVRVTATDASGSTVDTLTTRVVSPWDDGGDGVSAVPTDEDPLTSVALHDWQAIDGTCQEMSDGRCQLLTVASDGWYADDPLPTYAEVTLANGEQWNVSVNSYQVAGIARLAPASDTRRTCQIASAGGVFFRALVGGETLTDGTVVLSVTAYDDTAATLPTSETVTFTCTSRTGVVTTERATVAYDDEVAIVFANTFTLAEDPYGLELSGRVRLRGKQTLLVGRFAGQVGVDGGGELALAAIDRGEVAPRGDILIGGEPIDIEREVGGEIVPVAPPVIVRKNGKGTRNVATANNGSPGLL